jgi:hypothetical protein
MCISYSLVSLILNYAHVTCLQVTNGFFCDIVCEETTHSFMEAFHNLTATLEVLKCQRPLVSDCKLLMDLGSGFASAGFLALLPFARRLSGIAVKEVIHGAAGENKDVTDAHGSYFKSRLRDNVAHNLGNITSAQTLTASASASASETYQVIVHRLDSLFASG